MKGGNNASVSATYESREGLFAALNISESTIGKLQKVFQKIDVDGSGGIDEDELKQGLDKIGINPTEEQLEDMYVTMNNDGNDDITYVQFMKLMCSLKEKDIIRRNSSYEGSLLDMDVEDVKRSMSSSPEGEDKEKDKELKEVELTKVEPVKVKPVEKTVAVEEDKNTDDKDTDDVTVDVKTTI